MDGKTIVITGGAGYVGEMLCEQFAKRADVSVIIAIDKEPQSDVSKNIEKVVYIQHNLADDGWQAAVQKYNPDTIIHTAWQIRAMYGNANEQWRWNVDGSQNVFDFAFTQPSTKKLIYFSTASSYSARSDNRFDHLFTEEQGFRDDDYIYAKEKKTVEDNLYATYSELKKAGQLLPQVSIVRPAAITGPRGRYMRIRFGLQSALQGNLSKSFTDRLVTTLTSFVPATKGWVRQFIHEDDVTDAVATLVFDVHDWDYEAFNLTPEGEPVYASDMAQAVEKRILPITPSMARLAFFCFWHGTRGKVPTCPGSWRFYSYPILMSGQKLAEVYTCQYSSKDAFQYTDGRYEDFVPAHLRKPKHA